MPLYVGLGILVLWILGFIAFHVMIKHKARIPQTSSQASCDPAGLLELSIFRGGFNGYRNKKVRASRLFLQHHEKILQ
jgi:hypothetical protein